MVQFARECQKLIKIYAMSFMDSYVWKDAGSTRNWTQTLKHCLTEWVICIIKSNKSSRKFVRVGSKS